MSTEIRKINKQELSKAYHLDNFNAFSEQVQPLIDSKSLPSHIKSPETAFTVAVFGRDYGFSPMQSWHFVTPVKGVNTLNGKGINHLLRSKNYWFKPIDNAAFIYSDGKQEIRAARRLHADEIAIKLGYTIEEFKALDDKTKIRIGSVRDRVTKLEYGQTLVNGERKSLGTYEYFYSDAEEAELTGKDTYQKYPRDMMMYRAKTQLAKLLGEISNSETEELSVIKGGSMDIKDIQEANNETFEDAEIVE